MEKIGYLIGGYNSNTPEFNGNGISAKSRLTNLGHTIIEGFDYQELVYIAIDHDESDLEEARGKGIDSSHSILVINEPRVVRPVNFKSKVQANYGLIIVMGGNPKKYKTIVNWPQPWTWNLPETRTARKPKPVIIASNRISFIAGERYSLRRKVIKRVDGVDFFGRDWDYSFKQKVFHFLSNFKIAIKGNAVPRISSMKYWFKTYGNSGGEIGDKNDTLQKYAYSIVIENSDSYLSEKLFDCFFNSTIPIYVGPAPSDYGIPEDLVVHCKGTLKAIVNGIHLAEGIDYGRWRQELENWLTQEATIELWESKHVYSKLSDTIREYSSSLIK